MHTTEYQYLQTNHSSQIFLAHYLPLDQTVDKAGRGTSAVVLVPPFAEELNRSKRMYILCARLLANSGIHAICFDYSGTGDSSGEWGEFCYSDWVNDLHEVYRYAGKYTFDISFIALRFGALVLMDAMLEHQMTAGKSLFWDPLENGDLLTRQLVRMKIAAAMSDNAKKITNKEVIESIENNGFLESAGYHLPQSMLDDINTKKISSNIDSILNVTDVHWMTSAKPGSNEKLWLANTFKDEQLNSNQLSNLHMHAIGDVKFWMQQEVTIAPKMLRRTHEVIAHG